MDLNSPRIVPRALAVLWGFVSAPFPSCQVSSPIQVLTRLDPAYFPRSDKIGHIQGDLAMDLPAYYLENRNAHSFQASPWGS